MADTYSIIVEVQAEEKLARLKQQIDVDTEAITRLNAQFGRSPAAQQAFVAAATPAAQRIAAATAESKKLEAQLRGLGGGSKNAAMGFLEVSRAVEDAQYGFRGVVNNIPGIVQLFGGGAGLAAGVSIASVAINQLINHWDSLSDRLKAAWSGSSVEQLEALRQKAEEAAKAFEKINPATKSERETAKGTQELIEEQGRDRLAHKLGEAIGATHTPLREEMTAQEKTLLAENEAAVKASFNNAGFREALEGARKQISDRVTAANRKQAEQLLGAATTAGAAGDQARNTIRSIQRMAPGVLPGDFLKKLEETTPEGRAKKEAEQASREADIKGRENTKRYLKQQEDEALGGLMKSPLARLEAEGKGGSLGDLEKRISESLKASGMAGVDARHAAMELRDRIGKQVRQGRLAGKTEAQARQDVIDKTIDPESKRRREEAKREADQLQAARMREAERDQKEAARERARRNDQVAKGLDNSPAARALLMFGERSNAGKMIGDSLKRAGITDVSPLAVLTELKEDLEQKVQAKSLQFGVDRKTARQLVLGDTLKGKGGERQKAEFLDPLSYAKRTQQGILNGGDKVPQQQLEQLKLLVQLAQKKTKAAPAVAASP